MPELDTNKIYAWRIIAKNNATPVATSETWSFRVKQFGLETGNTVSNGYFVHLRRDIDASYIICTGILRYVYAADQNGGSIDVKITDISSVDHKPVPMDSTSYPVKYGQNFMVLDMREYYQLTDRHIYLLEVTNTRREHWYLKFEYRQPQNH
jgi:hypothetical protein